MRRLTALGSLLLMMIAACSSSDDDGGGGTTDAGAHEASTVLAADADTTGDATSTTMDAAPAMDAALGEDFTGQATYYDADGTGACGFKATPNDLLVAAMNGSQYKKALCGQCVFVTGPKGTVKVRIVDLCPGCAMGGLDLSETAFAKISPLSAGRVKITWHFVSC